MPLICIGPVCIPWTFVWPVVLLLLRPVWDRLPAETQQKWSRWWLRLWSGAAAVWASTPLARWWPLRASAATPPATAEPAPTMAGDAAAPAVAPTLPLEETLAQAGGLGPWLETKQGAVLVVKTAAQWRTTLAAARECGAGVLVMFTAQWCKPCKQIYPTLLELSQVYAGSLVFLKMDIDDVEEVADECKVYRGIPLFQLYHKGEMVAEVVGARPEKLSQLLEDHTRKQR